MNLISLMNSLGMNFNETKPFISRKPRQTGTQNVNVAARDDNKTQSFLYLRTYDVN